MTRQEIMLRLLLNDLKQAKGAYGYDFWLPNAVEQGFPLWNWAVEVLKAEPPLPYSPPSSGMVRHFAYGEPTRESKMAAELYPVAADILWLLCLRGILRLGVRQHDGQAVSSGAGYSLTAKGREWVKNQADADVQELLNALE